MKFCVLIVALCGICFTLLAFGGAEAAEPAYLWQRDALDFSGYSWDVKSGYYFPGKNHWQAQNAWVDDAGWLHLRLNYDGEFWQCAEVATGISGYGLYRFYLVGRIDQLDDQVVLGLFLYPGPRLPYIDNAEIDIEFSRWGQAEAPAGHFSVASTTTNYPVQLQGTYSTHQILWLPDRIEFSSYHGHEELNETTRISHWIFHQSEGRDIPKPPLQLHINYWLFKGRPLTANLQPDMLIRKFEYFPAGEETGREARF